MTNVYVSEADGQVAISAPSVGIILGREEATAMWSALTAHFLSNPDTGSEFAFNPVPMKPSPVAMRDVLTSYRNGDEFPDVGYVRYMQALIKVPA